MEDFTIVTTDLDTDLAALVSLNANALQVEELEDRLEMAAGTFCCCCCCGGGGGDNPIYV